MSTEELEARVRALEGIVLELTARVRINEDITEIQQLQWRYINALMTAGWDDVIECFAEDALIDVYRHEPVSGKAAITKWCGRTGAGRSRSCGGRSGWVSPAAARRKVSGREREHHLGNACRPVSSPTLRLGWPRRRESGDALD